MFQFSAMPSKVFISYRRDDAGHAAGRIHDRLKPEFGADLLFIDVDAIPLGVNFIKVLRDEVAKCDVLLALIGANWLNATDPKTKGRRLGNPSDLVRIEIGEALARGIPVVPVLIDGVPMPDIDLLPDDLKELVNRQAEFVEYRTFDSDVERLIRKLKLTEQPAQAAPSKPVVASMPGGSVDDEGRIKVDAPFIQGAPGGWFKPGAGKTEWFKDHEHGPDMVVVPAGKFQMGSTDHPREQPVHEVVIPSAFAVGRFAVTFAEWDACGADDGFKRYRPDDNGWGRDRRPVINVSWHDAKLYIDWLNAKTGKIYRLLSEAEWEYVTRAETTTPYWWGSSITSDRTNYNRGELIIEPLGRKWLHRGPSFGVQFGQAPGRAQTVPVDTFEPNPWGLFNVHGNVWEWCEDIWHDTYNYAPTDGSAWLRGGDDHERVVRGGSWNDDPQDLRAAIRSRNTTVFRFGLIGFRLARTLIP
jgi:formylglycine-generating enzyme required for sulfatase activity